MPRATIERLAEHYFRKAADAWLNDRASRLREAAGTDAINTMAPRIRATPPSNLALVDDYVGSAYRRRSEL